MIFVVNSILFRKEIDNIKNNNMNVKWNLFLDDYKERKAFYSDNNSVITSFVIIILDLAYYLLINPIIKLIRSLVSVELIRDRRKHNGDKYKYSVKSKHNISFYSNIILDIIIIAGLLVEIFIYHYAFSIVNTSGHDNLLILFRFVFIYRILTIFILRSCEILRFNQSNSRYESYPRTFLIFIINLIEIFVSYAYLYNDSSIKIFKRERGIDAILSTINISSIISREMSVGNISIVISQYIMMFILISYFLTNIRQLKYKN